jgi:hypothetical protein
LKEGENVMEYLIAGIVLLIAATGYIIAIKNNRPGQG